MAMESGIHARWSLKTEMMALVRVARGGKERSECGGERETEEEEEEVTEKGEVRVGIG